MKVEVHLIAYNEQRILPFSIRHYKQFASSIIVHDKCSTDATVDIAKEEGCKVISYGRSRNCLDDQHNALIKSNAWRGTCADWVIVADADELVYFRDPVNPVLSYLSQKGVPVVVCEGWELFSEEFPSVEDPRQIWEQVTQGAPDHRWYSKPILLNPRRVTNIDYAAGAHGIRRLDVAQSGVPLLRNALGSRSGGFPILLLHCKHLGPIDEIANRYDMNQRRMSDLNRTMGWGVVPNGMAHALEKRQRILSLLRDLPLAPTGYPFTS